MFSNHRKHWHRKLFVKSPDYQVDTRCMTMIKYYKVPNLLNVKTDVERRLYE